MKKILYIRRNADVVNDGTVNYCSALARMFADGDDVRALPIPQLRQTRSLLFHYGYDHRELAAAIAEADIVHVNGYTALGTVQALREARRQGKRVIYSPHWHPFEHLNHPLGGRAFFELLMKPAVKSCADIVCTINREDTAFFSSFHRDVRMIPHWVDGRSGNLGLPRHKDMLLFVGRVNDPVKGIAHLYHIPEGRYDIHCVGNGVIERRSDITHHVGISDAELDRLYAQAALVVVPSRYEAFSYVALEALMAGTPVLMSDRVRIADHLGGASGYRVFDYGDYDAFNSLIQPTIDTVVDVQRIGEIFLSENVRERYRDVYLQSI